MIKTKNLFILFSTLIIFVLFWRYLNFKNTRDLYAVVSSTILLYLYYKFLYCINYKNFTVIYKIILSSNLTIIVLFYYSRFEFGLPLNDFKVGFTYSNFWDFYYQMITVSDGTLKAINTGYFPFNYAIAKIFAELNSWRNGYFNISNRVLGWYLLYVLIFLSPIYLFYKKHCTVGNLNIESRFGLIALIATSYPILFVIERGNFVVVSFFFFAFFVYFYNEKNYKIASIFIGFFIGLKIMNFVVVVFLINKMRRYLLIIIGIALSVNFVSLIYLFDFNFTNWVRFKISFLAPLQGLFPQLFTESFIVTDGGRLQGMSSVDNFRYMIKVLIGNNIQNATTNNPLIESSLIIIAILILIIFYLKYRKILIWYYELILIFLLITLFHSGSADYNLILFIPLLFIIYWNINDSIDFDILKFLSVILTITITIPIFLIEINHSTFNTVSLKSFILPFCMITTLYLIFIKCRNIKTI